MNKQLKYSCPKCGSKNCKTGEIRTTGGFFTSFLNIQYKHFTSVICSECGYTELYSLPLKKLFDILDIKQDI
ncbi:MAG: zinc ribbon domain-containing protein [Bacteroidota bacterium]